MDYTNLYENLIAKYGSWKKPKGVYTERHRKIPGYLGGKYVEGNAFYVPARVHYLAHVLLAKIHGGHMWTPILLMGHRCNKSNSKFYATAREKVSNWMSENAPCKNPEIAKKQSEKMKGDRNPAKRKEVREKMGRPGVLKTEEHKRKIALAYEDPERRNTQLSQIHSIYMCSECGLETNAGNLGKHQKSTGHVGKERK